MLAWVSPAMAVLMVGGLGGTPVMVMEKDWLAAGGLLLTALTVPLNVPNVLGTPEMFPVAVLRVNPGGNVCCGSFEKTIVDAPLAITVYE